jgi:HlyD family secretion protein
MAPKKKKLIIGLAIGLVVVIIIVLNITRSSEKAIEVQAEEVQRGEIVSTVSAAGKVQPETEVDISANVSGKIVQLGVKEGDEVEEGQFLVRLDRNRYQALVDQAQAQLTSAEARLVEAEAEYRRVQELYNANLSSEADLEAARARRDVDKANYGAAKAYLDKTRDDLSKTTILSPMSGTVSQLNSEVGEVVLGTEQFSGTVIMTIADLSRMEVETDVDETDIVDVHVGQLAKIEVDALPDTVLRGNVTEIANTAFTLGRGTQEEVTNFKVKVAVLDDVPSLRPGMSATVDIETASHEDVIYVPIQCVVMRSPKHEDEEERKAGQEKADEPAEEAEEISEEPEETAEEQEGTAEQEASDTDQAAKSDPKEKSKGEEEELIEVVFVVSDETAKMVPVKAGISSDTNTEILSGLEGGEMVVTGSYRALRDLRDGQKVKIEKPAEKQAKEKD